MPNIDEILREVGFTDWPEEEKMMLSKLMYNFANKKTNYPVTGNTDRVLTTFIKILDTHLPEKED